MEQTSTREYREIKFNINDIKLHNVQSAVVVIDQQGKMIRANASWNDFLVRNHLLLSEGNQQDYFEIRRRFNQADTFEAYQGINRVLSLEEESFSMDFYCHIAMAEYTMKVSPIELQEGTVGAAINHIRKDPAPTLIPSSEHDYTPLIEASSEGVMIVELPNGTIRQANQTVHQLLGYSNESLLEQTFWDITPTEWHQTEHNIIFQKLADCGLASEIEKTFIRQDGSLFNATICYWAIKEIGGQPKSIWITVKDACQAHFSEQTALEAQKLQSLGSITHGMAHELNNILSIIMANTEMLELQHPLDARVSPHTDNILNATHRASALLQGISTFNQLSGTEFEEVELFSTVTNALRILQITMPPNITLTPKIATDELVIYANASQIQQMLITLAQYITHSLKEKAADVQVRLKSSTSTFEKTAELCVLSSHAFISNKDIARINTLHFNYFASSKGDFRLKTLYRVLQNHRCKIESLAQEGMYGVRVIFPQVSGPQQIKKAL